MKLTAKQEDGLRIAIQRYNNREKYTVIGGYAGTGKSTLVKFIIDALQVDEKDVVYTSFTGKACQVLQKKGNKNVSTLHKLLYESIPRPDGTFFRRKVEFIPYEIVVVDEVSMAPKELMDLLFSFPIYVICLGDPFQLPPVNDKDDNHLLDRPHVFLSEIMRQAEESEIIRLSMGIREGKIIDFHQGSEVQILKKSQMNTGMLQWADQILVGTNKVRKDVNNQMRDLLGRVGGPQDGDKVICLRNYWECYSDEIDGDPLVNGTIGFLKNSFESFNVIPDRIKIEGERKVETIVSDFITDTDRYYSGLCMDKKMILEGEASFSRQDSFKIGSYRYGAYKHLVPMEFTYGYAITCHKSQGSEWDKVLVIEENFPFNREEHARWLYTAVTRASEKLVLLRN